MMGIDFLLDELTGEARERALHVLHSSLEMYYGHVCAQTNGRVSERRQAYLGKTADATIALLGKVKETMAREGVDR